MKSVLNVPYFSQNSDSVPKEWHDSACGIATVKMVLAFLNGESPDMSFLLREGQAIGGFTEKGWRHESLVRILRNHGVLAYPQEFVSTSVQIDEVFGITRMRGKDDENFSKIGLQKILSKLSSGLPVIVSVSPKFNGNKHSHLILIIGYDQTTESLYYHDPDSRDGTELKAAPISTKNFLKFWRRLAIFPN